MKKFYTLAIAAAVALSATAFEFHPKADFGKLPAKKMMAAEQLIKTNTPKKAASRALTMDDIVGTYEWNGYSLFDKGMIVSAVEIAALGTDSVTITLAKFANSDFGNVLRAAVDLAEGTVSIPSGQYLGFNEYNQFDVYFNVMLLDDTAEDGVAYCAPGTPAVGVIDENGSIIFTNEDELWGIGNNDIGYFQWTGYNSFDAPAPDPEMPGTWASAGTVSFVDGWVFPCVIDEATDAPYDNFRYPWIVEVERCVEEPTMFRLVNPYIAETCPLTAGYEGYIAFDLADPEFVGVIPGYPAGMSNGSDKLRFFNIEGFYLADDFTKEDIIEALGKEMVWSSYNEGVVKIENCRFNYRGAEEKAYVWQYQKTDGEVVSCAPYMKGQVTFDVIPEGIDNAGISNVTVDNNAPAVYYNLQGVRVDNPSNGLYIRRQGNTVTKVMAK